MALGSRAGEEGGDFEEAAPQPKAPASSEMLE